MFLAYTFVLLITFSLIYFSKYLRVWFYLSNIPGPKPLPIIGNAQLFRGSYKHYGKVFSRLFKKYGNIFTLWVGPVPVLFISHPEFARLLLMNTNSVDKSWVFKYVTQDYGDSIGVSIGEKWKRHRKIIAAALSQLMLNSYLPRFNEKSSILITKLDKELNAETVFSIAGYLSRVTLDTVCEFTMGIDISSQINNSPYFEALKSDSGILTERFFKLWLFPNFIFRSSRLGKQHKKNYDVLWGTVEKAIKKRREELEKNRLNNNQNDEEKTFLDMLFEAEEANQFTEEQIKIEINFLILAGTSTTALSLSFTLISLGYLKDIQSRVYEEIYDIFGNSERAVTLDDLSKLVYLEMVIKESLRLFPVIPHLERETVEDIQLGNYKIPKGCQLVISLYHIHRDPNIWKDPNKFNPERFLSNDYKSSYIPFASGPRICAGGKYAMMFMKVILVYILRRYEIHSDLNIEKLNLTVNFTLHLNGGHLLRLKKRSKNI